MARGALCRLSAHRPPPPSSTPVCCLASHLLLLTPRPPSKHPPRLPPLLNRWSSILRRATLASSTVPAQPVRASALGASPAVPRAAQARRRLWARCRSSPPLQHPQLPPRLRQMPLRSPTAAAAAAAVIAAAAVLVAAPVSAGPSGSTPQQRQVRARAPVATSAGVGPSTRGSTPACRRRGARPTQQRQLLLQGTELARGLPLLVLQGTNPTRLGAASPPRSRAAPPPAPLQQQQQHQQGGRRVPLGWVAAPGLRARRRRRPLRRPPPPAAASPPRRARAAAATPPRPRPPLNAPPRARHRGRRSGGTASTSSRCSSRPRPARVTPLRALLGQQRSTRSSRPCSWLGPAPSPPAAASGLPWARHLRRLLRVAMSREPQLRSRGRRDCSSRTRTHTVRVRPAVLQLLSSHLSPAAAPLSQPRLRRSARCATLGGTYSPQRLEPPALLQASRRPHTVPPSPPTNPRRWQPYLAVLLPCSPCCCHCSRRGGRLRRRSRTDVRLMPRHGSWPLPGSPR